MVPKPHFLLFCEGRSPRTAKSAVEVGAAPNVRGRWRFVLEDLDAGTRLEAGDAEMVKAPERAALLAVVRGLEALEQPSRVTLVTTSRYVARGLQFGLIEWRESDYCWEHFGSVQPIRNADLWRRVDHAMQYHQINCQWIAGQVAEDGEETTQLSAEPIASEAIKVDEITENATTAMANSRAEERGMNAAQDLHEGIVSTLTASVDDRPFPWWQIALDSSRQLVRSLRLPNASTFLRRCFRGGSWSKFSSQCFASNKGANSRGFAI